jgi:CRP-like cAMP-binding protein
VLLPHKGKSMSDNSTKRSPNQLLASLTVSDLALLQPHLTTVSLKLLHDLERPCKPIEHIYFMHSGFASVVAAVADDPRVEIGLIGREGMSGAAVLLGNGQSPHATYMQADGSGEQIEVRALRNAIDESKTLQRQFLKYIQSFMVQTAHTAIANARATLPERLARWVLMAHDRLDGPRLPLTHEFLRLMLGVRRAGVTEALKDLGERRLIEAGRGEIIVLDRAGLKRIAGKFYGLPEREHRRLIGSNRG